MEADQDSTKLGDDFVAGHGELAAIAAFLRNRGLEAPAALLLECVKPLTTLLHTSTLFAEPLAAPILGSNRYRQLLSLLEDRQQVETLLELLTQEGDPADRSGRAARNVG